jgi:membrane-associated phospholipid phosphatase
MKLIEDFARFYPAATIIYALMTGDIYLFVFLIISNLANGVLKYKIAKPLMRGKIYTVIGSGERPKGAKHCGIWKDPPGHITKSYGMPSGHSQEATGFATYMILKNISEGNEVFTPINIILSGLAIFIMHSRVDLNCHTIQQVIAGGLIGVLFGTAAFKYKTSILKVIKDIF